MKKKHSSRITNHDPKKVIIKKTRKGTYDRNPLLAVSHQLVCKNCGSAQKITYLDHLKSGRFELGKTKVVEVVYAAPTITGLTHARETITPVMIRTRCRRCGVETWCSPTSLEYLLFTAEKQQKMENLYV